MRDEDVTNATPPPRDNEEGNDVQNGEEGNDVQNDEEGNDVQNGEEGNDGQNDEEGNDVQNGEEGNDVQNGEEDAAGGQEDAENWQIVRRRNNDNSSDSETDSDDVSLHLEREAIEAITRLSLGDEWTLLERRVIKTLRLRRKARALVADTNEWLCDFIARRGEAGREMARNIPQQFEDLQETAERADQYLHNLQERRAAREAALRQRQAAENELRAFQEATRRQAKEIAKKLAEATRTLKTCSSRKTAMRQEPERTLRCPICGLEYVPRGRDCPAISTHHAYREPRE
ncbi:unnamed protein product [Trichogramma brassicae]|uniref:Uncharacterized protein n=1 Tax=Trichogramma brassicae TaxID=86971 RepID=A0A6H5I701_9HYME|nr:unnamed protein product [Trichogramma brassicae]